MAPVPIGLGDGLGYFGPMGVDAAGREPNGRGSGPEPWSSRLAGALGSALMAALMVGLVDAAWAFRDASAALLLLSLPLAPAVIVAVGQAAWIGVVDRVVGALTARWPDQLQIRSLALRAALLAAPMTPVVVLLAVYALDGRFARTLPARPALMVGAIAVGFAALFGAVRWLVRPVAPGWRTTAAALFLLGALACVADRLWLVRRYGFAHIGMELAAFAAWQLAIVQILRGRPSKTRSRSNPIVVCVIGLLGLTAGVLATREALHPARSALRAAVYERGTFGAHMLDGAAVVSAYVTGRPATPRSPLGDGLVAPSDESQPSVPPRWPAADVVLITVDALRADHLGLYGYHRPTSPRLDALARRSVVFERAYAAAPHTSYSIASLLMGRHAFGLSQLGLVDAAETLADVFRRSGHGTVGVFPPAIFFVDAERFQNQHARRYGFATTRFETLDERTEAADRTNHAIEELSAAGGAPVFLWVHYFAPHEPYVAHQGPGLPPVDGGWGDASTIDRYDREIAYVDLQIGRLLDHLAVHRPGAIVVVTADHGEEFGEHGGAYHGTTLFEEQLRVPLLVALPDGVGRRVAAPVSLVNVAPTLAALVGAPPPVGAAPPLRMLLDPSSSPPASPVFAELDSLRAIMVGDDKLICDSRRAFCRLYDLRTDPAERIDRAAGATTRARQLEARLNVWIEHESGASVSARPDGPAHVPVILTRAMRGDPVARSRLLDLVEGAGAAGHRIAAARLVARSPAEADRERLAALSRSDPDAQVRLWSAVALVSLWDSRSVADLVPELPPACVDPELVARRALALAAASAFGSVDGLSRALDDLEDVSLRCEVVLALGRSGDPAALPALMAAYDHVRSRPCVARALGRLARREALPFIVSRLPTEPYVTVQAELVAAVARIGDPRAVGALRELLATAPESLVADQIGAALRQLAPSGTPGSPDPI